MAGTFTNRKKLIMLASAVAEKMPYIKNATSLFSEGEIARKKYGHAMHGYLPDAGSVSAGLVAHPDKAHQVEITAYIDNFNTAAEVDLWDELLNIEDFKKEIVDKKAGKLAREVQKSIMKQNMFRSNQVIVKSAFGFDLLSEANSALEELNVDGDKVDFQSPTGFGKIANSGLAKFIPSEKMNDIYEDSYLGQYAGAACVNLPGCPIIDTTGMDAAPTITAKVVKDASNNIIGIKPFKAITGSGTGSVIAGVPYKLSGLKIVDEGGIETDQDYVVIPVSEVVYGEDANGDIVRSEVVTIPEIRVTATGKAYGNPNAHIAASAISAALSGDDVTFTLSAVLTASKQYQVGQVRTVKSLSWDQYRFQDLPAAKQENVGTYDGVMTLKMQSAPEVLNGVAFFRIDLPFCSKLWEPRQSVTTYVEL